MYHEFVYVSDEKVRQAVPQRASWWQGMRARRLGVKVSAIEASLELEPSDLATDERQLARLMRYFEESGRYYTEPDVTAGEWVMFDGRMGMDRVDGLSRGDAVLFCEAEPITVTTPRIVLHGSAHHLVTSASTRLSPEDGRVGGYSVFATAAVAEIIDGLDKSRLPDRMRSLRQLSTSPTKVTGDVRQNLATYFREVACTEDYRDFAPHLGGHARVTAVLRPAGLPFSIVLASPLYVRYEHP